MMVTSTMVGISQQSPGIPEETWFPKPPQDVAIVLGIAPPIWLIGLLAV